MKNRSCFDCQWAEIELGIPGCHTLPNGDPGYPDDPDVCYCMDPLAGKLAYEFETLLVNINSHILKAVWANCLELRNCDPKDAKNLTFEIRSKIAYDLTNRFDFARYCPMFDQKGASDHEK